jgi:hypothetical protein
MVVTCVVNTIEGALLRGLQSYQIEDQFHYDPTYPLLNLGQAYTVCGLLLTTQGIWVFILEDEEDGYPLQYPISFFDIVDATIPSDWVTGKGEAFSSVSRKVFALLAPKEWANNERFYEALVDGEPQAVAAFQKMYS